MPFILLINMIFLICQYFHNFSLNLRHLEYIYGTIPAHYLREESVRCKPRGRKTGSGIAAVEREGEKRGKRGEWEWQLCSDSTAGNRKNLSACAAR